MNKKYWRRFALVFAAVYIVLILILLPIDDMGIATSLLSPGTWLLIGLGLNATVKYVLMLVISIIAWGAFGALVGLVYGKIKNKNVVQ